jgi:hypothetical protein
MGEMASAILRANPGYELVLLDRLAEEYRKALDSGQELYGVLRPRPGADLEPRTASPDTALLFLTLAEPAAVPAYVRGRLGADTDRVIARLVLDSVLEIESGGEFISGARAGEIVLGGHPVGGPGRIGVLSLAALRYGQELAACGMTDEPLALRLYCYGRRPVTPALAGRLGNQAAIETYLGCGVGGAAYAALDGGWVRLPRVSSERAYWRSWAPRRERAATGRRDAAYKLYVSPDVEALGAAFAVVAGSLAGARGIRAFKVGTDVYGFCRPDKLVVHFDRLEDLQEGAARLRRELEGVPAHGVPFTAAVTTDGLLSWGADPPVPEGAQMSWRMWVSERLAEFLVLGGSRGLEPWQFALRRLGLAGVDTDRWIPASGMWEEALASA